MAGWRRVFYRTLNLREEETDMAMTVIDPSDGTSYELAPDHGRWTIRDMATGQPPQELSSGPWKTKEQALDALRQMCSHKELAHGSRRGY